MRGSYWLLSVSRRVTMLGAGAPSLVSSSKHVLPSTSRVVCPHTSVSAASFRLVCDFGHPCMSAHGVSASCTAVGPMRLFSCFCDSHAGGTPDSRYGGGGGASQEDDSAPDMPEFEFDPMASMRRDAAVESAKQSIQSVVESMLPPNAPASAVAKTRKYLEQHPVDTLIVHPRVIITHVQNSDTQVEEKMSLSPCSCTEALAQARERRMNLVQMGSRDDVAFCRIRNESIWIMKLMHDDLATAGDAGGSGRAETGGHTADLVGAGGAGEARTAMSESGSYHRPSKPRPQVEHAFRDMVDAHFIGWKSKKICQDLRKGHPVKLTIRDFQSAEAAVTKLREMCQAMKTYAEAERIAHNYTSIVAHDREASITFVPAYATTATPSNGAGGNSAKAIRHPSEKDWAHTMTRMEAACRKAGISGTYAKSNKLKPRNLGMRTYRVDKYGRRLD